MSVNLLRELPLFHDVSEELLEELAPLLTDLEVESGAFLCEQGMIGNRIFLIQTGQVRVSVTDDDGNEQVLGFLGPGHPIGEMSVISGDPISANVIATVKSKLKTIDGDSFLAFCDNHPILYRKLLRVLSERVRAGNRRRYTSKKGRVGWISSAYTIDSLESLDDSIIQTVELFARQTSTKPLLLSVAPAPKGVTETESDSNAFLPDNSIPMTQAQGKGILAGLSDLNQSFEQEWYEVNGCWECLVLRPKQGVTRDKSTVVIDRCIERLRPSFPYIFVRDYQQSLELLIGKRLADDNIMLLVDLIPGDRQTVASTEEYDHFVPEAHRYPPEPGMKYWVVEPKTLRDLESIAKSIRNQDKVEIVLVHRPEKAILDYSRIRKFFKGHSVHCFPLSNEVEKETNQVLKGSSYSLALGDAPFVAKCRAIRELSHSQVGIALGGGGARGMAHIGVIKTLEEEGIPIDFIAGSSMGGIVAAVYAQGRPGPRLLEDTRFYWSNLGNFLYDVLDYDFPRTNLLRGRKIKHIINTVMDGLTIEECQIPLALACTDLVTGKQVVLEEGNLGDAIIATGALPGIFRPVRWGKHLLVDGAVIDKVPARVLQKKGAKFIITVNVTPENDPHLDASGRKSHIGLRKTLATLPPFKRWKEEPNILQVVSRSLEVSGIHQSRSQIDLVDVEIKPKVEHFDFLRFDQFDQIVEAGAEAAKAALPEIRNLLETQKAEV